MEALVQFLNIFLYNIWFRFTETKDDIFVVVFLLCFQSKFISILSIRSQYFYYIKSFLICTHPVFFGLPVSSLWSLCVPYLSHLGGDTPKNFWHGSDQNGTSTKKYSTVTYRLHILFSTVLYTVK